jgi:hypothetical protein
VRPAELFAPQVAPQEDLLRQVFHVGLLDQARSQKAIDRVLIQLDECRECLLIASLGGSDERPVPLGFIRPAAHARGASLRSR